MKIGDKIRLTQETINEFKVPEDVHEGVVVNFSINQHGAFVKHTNGMIYALMSLKLSNRRMVHGKKRDL